METVIRELRREFERYNEATRRITGSETFLDTDHLDRIIARGDAAEIKSYRQDLRAGRAVILSGVVVAPG